MKKILFFVLICVISVPAIFAVEVQIAGNFNNYFFEKNGEIDPDAYQYGLFFQIKDQVVDNLEAKIAIESIIFEEYTVSGRVSYSTSYLEISAGPTFGILNKTVDKASFSYLIQPGLGIGFSIISPGYFVAKADTDFALPSATDGHGQAYIQKGELSFGFYLPHMLCSLAVRQKASALSGTTNMITGTTDYGFYTEAFKKGSPFRANVDFILRITDCFFPDLPDTSHKNSHLVLGGGITWAPNSSFNLFAYGTGSMYTISLLDLKPTLQNFLFDFKLGMTFLMGGKTNNMPF